MSTLGRPKTGNLKSIGMATFTLIMFPVQFLERWSKLKSEEYGFSIYSAGLVQGFCSFLLIWVFGYTVKFSFEDNEVEIARLIALGVTSQIGIEEVASKVGGGLDGVETVDGSGFEEAEEVVNNGDEF